MSRRGLALLRASVVDALIHADWLRFTRFLVLAAVAGAVAFGTFALLSDRVLP